MQRRKTKSLIEDTSGQSAGVFAIIFILVVTGVAYIFFGKMMIVIRDFFNIMIADSTIVVSYSTQTTVDTLYTIFGVVIVVALAVVGFYAIKIALKEES